MAERSQCRNVAVLGDSRVFDTYYVNNEYRQHYGYDRTFPHIWRRQALVDPDAGYDIIHIPDHFRGGTIQNNIIRLALTDPAVVVVVDGIWDTLINEGHFLDYVERKLRGSSAPAEPLDLQYSPERLVALYRAGELSVSPQQFAERIRTLVSYFRRRRRQVIVLTVPVPPAPYVGSTYHAGNYKPLPGWQECLAALSDTCRPVVASYGARYLDLTSLMEEVGGAEAAFIDQWHFSPALHELLANTLDSEVRALLPDCAASGHVSERFMLGQYEGDLPREVVIHHGGPEAELAALDGLGSDQILVYAHEIDGIDNPRGNDRAELEQQVVR